MASNHSSNSFFNNIALALTSSAVTAAIIFLTNTHKSSVEEEEEDDDDDDDEDDFEAHQAKPTSNDNPPSHVPYVHQWLSMAAIRRRSKKLLGVCQKRRTLRFFSSDPVPKDVVETVLQTACTSPSGAHKQPWTFVAVSSPFIKSKIREMVEAEETINYQSRMRKTWVKDLESMMDRMHPEAYNNNNKDAVATTIQKPYLTEAPWIVCVFKQTHGIDPESGQRLDHYYVQESVGIACGMLTVAIANANLVTLTSTPMGAEKGIRQLLGRPDNEKLFLLLPLGFPAKNATVPYRNPERKPASETIVWKQ